MNEVNDFHEVLSGEHITTVFQPIVSLRTGEVFGYEALSRITLPSCGIHIEKLFTVAAQEKKLWELERLCRTKALENALEKPSDAKLFINVDANVMQDDEFQSGFTWNKLVGYGMDPQDIIIEVTEKNAIKTVEAFTASINHYRAQHYKIAIDDFGTGYSGLSRACAFSPDFLKIDMELVRDIDKNALKKSAVSSTITFCKEFGIKLIAEGIETEGELKTLIRLGVEYGQGYYLAKPAGEFAELSEDLKTQIKNIYSKTQLNYVSSVFGRVDTISKPKKTIAVSEPALTVFEMMKKDHTIREMFAVDEEKRVCGIMTRSYILEKFGGQFGYNLSRKLTVERIMKKNFLAMEIDMPIEEVSSLAMQRDISQIYDAIAVTEDGKYYGTVSVKDLLMTTVQMQVKRATDLSPLTGLPGNVIIQDTIANTFLNEEPWAIIYLDLDNFKAYNDAYGFTNGDMMLKALANAMQECCDKNDFLGHIGGDDFVIITDTHAIQELFENICRTFRQSICKLYSRKDWARGYIVSQNRDGFTRNFPIATLSMAAVTNKEVKPTTIDELSLLIANSKKKSKQKIGDSICVV